MTSTVSWAEYKKPLGLSLGITALVWLLLFTIVIFDPNTHNTALLPNKRDDSGAPIQQAQGKGLLGYVPESPATVPFDDSYVKGSDDLPLDQPPLAKLVNETAPEQIHIALAGPDGIVISWATGNAVTLDEAPRNSSLPDIGTAVYYGTQSAWYDMAASGTFTSYVQTYPGATYISGFFHHVKLTGLRPDTTYFYKCGDPKLVMSEEHNFTTPPAPGSQAFPQRLTVVADLGQTHNSSRTLEHIIASAPRAVLLVGDLTYSDAYHTNGILRHPDPPTMPYQETYQPRWDAWGRMMAPLASQVPLMTVEGNHEIEEDAAGKTFLSYTARYRMPSAESGSPSQLYYSFDLGGSHVVMIGSYADWKPGSEQYQWLERDLMAFNRSRTPWLVAAFHSPWYNTYIAHYKELECMRVALEPLLYRYGVDIVFAGHVHSYERMNRVYNYTVDPCGPIHVTVGDGGNIEKLYTDWVDSPLSNCPAENTTACPTRQDGKFCPVSQPAWSAFREPSFGFGELQLLSATEARWTWHKNQDSLAAPSDTVNIIRNLQCANQLSVPL